MSKDPTAYNSPASLQLGPDQLDDVARALLSLTREVCVLVDRVAILERVLDDQGLSVVETVGSYQPDEALEAEIKQKTQRIIDDVLASLSGRSFRGS